MLSLLRQTKFRTPHNSSVVNEINLLYADKPLIMKQMIIERAYYGGEWGCQGVDAIKL